MVTERKRLDEVVVERGLAVSRNVARGMVMAGLVLVEGKVVDKAGTAVAVDVDLALKSRPRFVSRAGEKLAGAMETFEVSVAGRLALDVGASTGGFVDCLLQAGAEKVIALDVGRNQLDLRVRDDPRVIVMDGVNARLLRKGDLAYEPDMVTMDVSFISVGKVLGSIAASMADEFEGVILIKPQFEAGPKAVGKKGIVRDPRVHKQVLIDAARFASENVGLDVLGVCRSGVPGAGGNLEFFLHVARGREKGLGLDRLQEVVNDCVDKELGPQGGQ
jgi:23S rRNA (cytidine1920-2'-O)/16S rRNA (cytidine1409-2'-O)-methyltransferase